MALQRGRSARCASARRAAIAAQPGAAETGFFILRRERPARPTRLATLRALARVRLNADGRPLAHHVQELVEEHDRALEERQAISTASLPARHGRRDRAALAAGRVRRRPAASSASTSARCRGRRGPGSTCSPTRASARRSREAGGGYSWALNSRLQQLTPWSNDPVADPPANGSCSRTRGRMRGLERRARRPRATTSAEYRVAHGQGYSEHQPSPRRARRQRHLVRRSARARSSRCGCASSTAATGRCSLRLVGIAEWILGAQPGRPRHAPCTRAASQRAAPAQSDGAARRVARATSGRLTALLCTQRDRAGRLRRRHRLLRPRRRRRGPDRLDLRPARVVRRARPRSCCPTTSARRSGGGLDPCAALADPHHAARRRHRSSASSCSARRRAGRGAQALAAQRRAGAAAAAHAARCATHWDELLGATDGEARPTRCSTRWSTAGCSYQTVACRLWAQGRLLPGRRRLRLSRPAAGRDGARLGRARSMLRQQIVLAASRQFPEGDVQHWWHAPTGAGVRTHFSDDLLWLPHACAALPARHAAMPACSTSSVPFLEGARDARRAPRTPTTRPAPSARAGAASTSTARGRSTAACASARTACR